MYSQVTIGLNKAPETFSVLELISNSLHGLRLPQVTTLQREAISNANGTNPEMSGLVVFDTNTKCVCTWNGTLWLDLCAVPVSISSPFVSGSDNQTINLGSAITTIVYIITGSDGVRVTGLPDGVDYYFVGDSNGASLTISGIPTRSRTYNYTVTLMNGVTVTGTITVLP